MRGDFVFGEDFRPAVDLEILDQEAQQCLRLLRSRSLQRLFYVVGDGVELSGVRPDEELVSRRVDNAVARFRARGADNEERRVAVRELAGVLEILRPQIKERMLSADEKALFLVANGFAIRHNRTDQRRRYDGATWLSWTFYVYLATIHAMLRIVDVQRTGSQSTG